MVAEWPSTPKTDSRVGRLSPKLKIQNLSPNKDAWLSTIWTSHSALLTHRRKEAHLERSEFGKPVFPCFSLSGKGLNSKKNRGSFHVNSTRPLNPPSGILTKLGVYIIPTLVRNYAKYFFPKPHSFVYRRDQNFKISPLLTIKCRNLEILL